MARRPRQPTPEELAMWLQVTRDVEPLSSPLTPAMPVEETVQIPITITDPMPLPSKRKPLKNPVPQPLDRKTLRRIKARRESVDATLDLHGMTAAEAREILTRFILLAAEQGRRTLLIITGKGSGGSGVLKREFPHWLELPPLASLVLGFHVAHRADGGEGAFYVRLRQQRIGR